MDSSAIHVSIAFLHLKVTHRQECLCSPSSPVFSVIPAQAGNQRVAWIASLSMFQSLVYT